MSDSKDMHINESILSDEIREDLKKNRTNHMEYLPDMEVLESDIQQKVIDAMNNYDYDKYTAKDVLNAINKSNRTPEDFAALLSPAALPYLEQMAQAAKDEKERHFGNSICFFTPIYIANYCENYCVYCGFNCHNKIKRAKLNAQEIEEEMEAIARSGLALYRGFLSGLHLFLQKSERLLSVLIHLILPSYFRAASPLAIHSGHRYSISSTA